MRQTLCLMALLPFVAVAADDELQYSYVQIGYTSAEVDIGTLGELEADGPQLDFSVALGDTPLFVFGAYARGDVDVPSALEDLGFSADLSEQALGVGAHFGMSDKVSLYGGLGLADIQLDTNMGDVSDDGLYVRAGVRALFGGNVELRGGVERADFDELGEDTAYVVGLDLYPSSGVSFGFSYRGYDDWSVATAGVRLYFGDRARRGRGLR